MFQHIRADQQKTKSEDAEYYFEDDLKSPVFTSRILTYVQNNEWEEHLRLGKDVSQQRNKNSSGVDAK